MKVRSGFVSNSSSSSFICDECGENFCGYEFSHYDVDHYECENGHYFCEKLEFDHKKAWEEMQKNRIAKAQKYVDDKIWQKYTWYTEDEIRQELVDEQEKEYDEDYEWEDELPSEACPICRMRVFRDVDLLNFLLLEYDYTKEHVGEMMKKSFKSYNDFTAVVKEVNK